MEPLVNEVEQKRSARPRPRGGWSKVVRLAAMAHEMLHETRGISLDEAGRARLRVCYSATIDELTVVLPDDLRAELASFAPPLSSDASESELRLAQGALVGWLEGLMHTVDTAVWAGVVRSLTHAAREDGGRRKDEASPGQYL